MKTDVPAQAEACQDASVSEDEKKLRPGEFRPYLVNLQYKQVQTELIVNVVVAAIACASFWHMAPPAAMLGWALVTVLAVSFRSLFVSNQSSAEDSGRAEIWGNMYVYYGVFSGAMWGGFSFYAILNSEPISQMFMMFLLWGVTITAYISMQQSPRTIMAFVLPALLPVTGWMFYQVDTTHISIGVISVMVVMLMGASSRTLHSVLDKALGLGSHNTELIRNLVTAREAVEREHRNLESAKIRLQEEVKIRQAAEERIRESEQRLTAILDSMQDTIYQADADGNILWTTPSVRQLLGFGPEEVIDTNIKDRYVSNSEDERFHDALETGFGRVQNYKKPLRRKDNSLVWVSENSHYKYDENRCIIGVEGSMRDITALKKAEEALFREKERAEVTLSSIGDGVITTNLLGEVEYLNQVAEQSTGWKMEDAQGMPLAKVLNIVDEKTLKTPPDPVALCLENNKSVMLPGYLLLIHRHLNQRLSVEVIGSPLQSASGTVEGAVVVFHDVSELRSLSKMTYQASHDSLTGLINRREFEKRVSQALENSRHKDTRYALCYLDLDNFKVVNDTNGHVAGDELLKQLAIKLRSLLREADTLARLGGDEFGVLMEGCPIEVAKMIAEKIRRMVEEFRFVWDNNSFRVGVSIGLVEVASNSGSMTDLLSAADSACYVAKDQGRNRIHVYEPDDTAVVERHGQMQWVQKIHDVLEQDRFRLFFQPIARINRPAGESPAIHGEVLLRMLDDDGALIGPGAFIPSAERYCLMPAIDRWVVENTFQVLVENQEAVEKHLDACCINLSGQSLSDERFLDFVVDQIARSGVSPSKLCFEITETAVIANLSNASRVIAELRDMGCRFALDDFGVGLSSFGYLKNLAVDYLKLDGCFVKNMVLDNIDRAMVKAINEVGQTMHIRTIAEFVEDERTLQALRHIGVDYAQGYCVAKPVPIEIGICDNTVEDNLPPPESGLADKIAS